MDTECVNGIALGCSRFTFPRRQFPLIPERVRTQHTPQWDATPYSEPGVCVGATSVVILVGDCMQLPAFQGRNYDEAPLPLRALAKKQKAEKSVYEDIFVSGREILWDCLTDVHVLGNVYRFRDNVSKVSSSYLPRITRIINRLSSQARWPT